MNLSHDARIAAIEEGGGQYVVVADGRVVEYSVCGSTLPDATVLVSAYVAGCLMPTLSSHTEALERLNIRYITISFPSLGHSSPQFGHCVADWPETDLLPVLEAEGVDVPFCFWGGSLGAHYAMAVATHPLTQDRVSALGLRVPYLPRPLSNELGLKQGQPSLPKSEEVQANTGKVKMWRKMLLSSVSFLAEYDPEGPGRWAAFKRWLMGHGLMGAEGRQFHDLARDHRPIFEYMRGMCDHFGPDAMLHEMAEDTALDSEVDP
ncbi:hypothetical protein KIPB_001628, partial [Kipferlia bialata]|eukprot:g1628.t1